jgi:hypothetical protein
MYALGRDAARNEIFPGSLGTAGTKRDVKFTRPAFVGMAFKG